MAQPDALQPIALDELSVFGEGVNRPETVLVLADGRILVSDASDAALTEILPDGSLRRLGHKPGESNGITVLDERTVAFTVFDTGEVCTLDLVTEEVAVLADTVDGEPLTWPNYPLAAPDGTVWVSRTTSSPHPFAAIADILTDGSILRIDPDGKTTVAAGGLPFPNCMTFDADGRNLYVVRSTWSDVARYEIESGGGLRLAGRHGPVLGDRRPDEVGPGSAEKSFDPVIGRRWALTDGCAFDADGNLWVTLMTANKIVAITPDEQVVTVIDDPEGTVLTAPTSIAWGGADMRDLYIGSLLTPHVLKTRSPVAGRPLWHQRRA